MEHQSIGDVRVVGWVLAGVIITCAVGFALWVIAKRETRVVKGSQPFFLLLICVGTIIMGSAIFPLGMDDDYFDKVGSDCPECDSACKTWPWLLFIGFTVVFSAIFSKVCPAVDVDEGFGFLGDKALSHSSPLEFSF